LSVSHTSLVGCSWRPETMWSADRKQW
jgi:hypothetical protein